MPRTAEFELAHQPQLGAFAELLEESLSRSDGPIEPRVEITFPINVRTTHGQACLRFVRFHTHTNAGDTLTLKISFAESTLSFTSPLHLRLTPLEGSLLITAPVLFAGAAGAMAIDLDFARANANVQLSPERTPALFQQYLAEAVTAFVRPLSRRQFFRNVGAFSSRGG